MGRDIYLLLKNFPPHALNAMKIVVTTIMNKHIKVKLTFIV